MIGVEEMECEHRFRPSERCRVPTHTKELAVMVVGRVTCAALAKTDLYAVPTIEVDHGE